MAQTKYIHREIEPLVKTLVKQFPAVAITGPRQSGKSTLLKKIFPAYTYFTFDDPVTRERAIADPRLFLESGRDKMIIDEIQYVPEILQHIKIFIDEKRTMRGRFILTGSQQFNLIRNLNESLAGRISIIELLPFSVGEKKTALKNKFSSGKNYFLDACLQGSFPEIVVYRKETNPEFWYSSYLQTYLERDIRTVYNIGNLRDFQRFLKLMATRCSQILNLSALAIEIGVAVNTIKRWISLLEASRTIFLLPPYYNNLGKRIVQNPKVYFLDCGLACHLLSIKDREYLLNGPMAGSLFENFCIQETFKQLIHHGKRTQLFYARTHNMLEIDLIVEKDGQLFPVEFKITRTPKLAMIKPIERFKALFAKLPIQAGMLVTLGEKSASLSRDATLLNIDDYLSWINK